MKKLGIYKTFILPGCMALVGMFSSCSAFDDFLTVYPTNQITGEQFWEDKNDLISVLASCYKQMSTGDVQQRMFVWGEFRSDNFLLRKEDDENLLNIMNANLLPTNTWFNWASYYKGIGFCNLVLSKGEDVIAKDPSFTEGDWKPIAAECKALRALYYFYLVRAFRDVPFNVKANDTSLGARDPMPQTPSQEILTYLINDLESCKDDGMSNYGNSVYNRGRITRDAIYTLLADLYLWRAAKNSSADSAAKYPGMAKADYAKVIECCDYVLSSKIQEFKREHQTYYGEKDATKTPYPIYEPDVLGRVTDNPYNMLFGWKNSAESIFELQYDGTNSENTAVTTFFGGLKNGQVQPGVVGGSSIVQSVDQRQDPKSVVYSKSDLRMAENIMYKAKSEESNNYQLIKYIASGIQVVDGTNVTLQKDNQSNVNYSDFRNTARMDANWIIYRVSDVMLMKAEAIACLYNQGDPELEVGYDLCKSVDERSNPLRETQYNLTYDSYNTPTSLLEFVMRERQREFYGEGKRWFDLVRMAMRDGNTSNMLNLLTAKYTTNASAIKAKLATLNSLYSPVFKDEMKVNTALVQNPAWVVDETIVKN